MKEQETGLPEGWELSTLADLTRMIRGVSYKKEQSSTEYIEGYLPVLRANNIQDNQIILDDLVYVQADLIKEEQKLKTGDIVVAMSSGSKSIVGKTARVEEDKNAGFGAFCGVLRPKNNVEPRLISQFTQSSYYRNTISALSAGANINNLKPSHFKEIDFPLPPLPEQQYLSQKLTALLDSVAEVKQRLENIPALLKQFRQSILADAVSGKLTEEWRGTSDYDENGYPIDWTISTLGKELNYGSCKKKSPEEILENEWVLELEDIEKDTSRIIFKETNKTRKAKSTKNIFKKNDVLYGKLRPYLNKIVIADEDGVCTTEIIPISGNEKINHQYLFYWLKSPYFFNYVNEITYGVNMPRLGTQDGKKALIAIPPKAEQTQIIQKVETYFALADKIETQAANALAKVNLLSQSILAKAFRGELSADWREKHGLSS